MWCNIVFFLFFFCYPCRTRGRNEAIDDRRCDQLHFDQIEIWTRSFLFFHRGASRSMAANKIRIASWFKWSQSHTHIHTKYTDHSHFSAGCSRLFSLVSFYCVLCFAFIYSVDFYAKREIYLYMPSYNDGMTHAQMATTYTLNGSWYWMHIVNIHTFFSIWLLFFFIVSSTNIVCVCVFRVHRLRSYGYFVTFCLFICLFHIELVWNSIHISFGLKLTDL